MKHTFAILCIEGKFDRMYRKADPDKWSLPYTTDPEKAMHFDNIEDLNKEIKSNERLKLIHVNGEKNEWFS